MAESTENGSSFDGSVLGNFGTTFVMGLITSITLGIGLPWAVAYRQRWLVGHTLIEGKRLTFEGTDGQLFGNYIKWWFFPSLRWVFMHYSFCPYVYSSG